LIEASLPKYFVDGFLIKYFNIYPIGFEKDNLFDEQRVFLVYLMGFIPSQENWNIQVEYKQQLQEIKNLKDIKLEQTDIDLAKLQNRDITEIKQERLKSEKDRKLKELNKKFGIKEKEEENNIGGLPVDVVPDRQERLWEILQGKGLTNNGL
jgi:hypothetical protein